MVIFFLHLIIASIAQLLIGLVLYLSIQYLLNALEFFRYLRLFRNSFFFFFLKPKNIFYLLFKDSKDFSIK